MVLLPFIQRQKNKLRIREKIKPEIDKIESFIIPKGKGVNYKAGVWHFPLIATEVMDFLVVDRKGSGENLIIENLVQEKILLEY